MSQLQDARAIFSVSQLNREVGLLLQQGFGRIWVQGEISNLSIPRSGHWYLTLKDSDAQLRCAMFRNANRLLRDAPSNGDQVLVRGRLGLYEARGDYQLIIEHLEPAGEGALRMQFEALKRRLDSEGLFDPARKRPLPAHPRCIGIVTSATGAALRDIRAVLSRRCPLMDVVVYPTLVQGDRAAAGIADAIERANLHGVCDVLLVSRGGGSLEDLWPFNEEIVARAIVNARMPVISGVGHEIDTTIADLVSDLRAPTPSAAAELAVPDLQDTLHRLRQLRGQLERGMLRRLDMRRRDALALHHRLSVAHPGRQLEQRSQHVDDLAARLQRQVVRRVSDRGLQVDRLQGRLETQHPALRLQQADQSVTRYAGALERAMQQRLERTRVRVEALGRELEAVSPLAVLNRGFSVASDERGEILRSVKPLEPGARLRLRLADGQLITRVESVEPNSD